MSTPPTKEEIDAYARTHGFPDSDYPYAEHINTCGSNDFSSIVPDGWYCVSFENACRNHDRCYITLGSVREECDERFMKDLQSACWQYIMRPWKQARYEPTPADIAIYHASAALVGPWVVVPPTPALRPNPLLPIPPTAQPQAVESLHRAYRVAEIYYLAVKATGGSYFAKSQELARNYKALVEDFLAGRTPVAEALPSWLLLLLDDSSSSSEAASSLLLLSV